MPSNLLVSSPLNEDLTASPERVEGLALEGGLQSPTLSVRVRRQEQGQEQEHISTTSSINSNTHIGLKSQIISSSNSKVSKSQEQADSKTSSNPLLISHSRSLSLTFLQSKHFSQQLQTPFISKRNNSNPRSKCGGVNAHYRPASPSNFSRGNIPIVSGFRLLPHTYIFKL
jgi:hypothetical protein